MIETGWHAGAEGIEATGELSAALAALKLPKKLTQLALHLREDGDVLTFSAYILLTVKYVGLFSQR